MKPGDLIEFKGRYFWVVDKPENVRDWDFAEWENGRQGLALSIFAYSTSSDWKSADEFVDANFDHLGRLLFLRELDPLCFAMMRALAAMHPDSAPVEGCPQ